MPSTAPLDAPLCPLCSRRNACSVACSGSFDTACWCTGVQFSRAVLARVPPAQQGRACLCQACAEGRPA